MIERVLDGGGFGRRLQLRIARRRTAPVRHFRAQARWDGLDLWCLEACGRDAEPSTNDHRRVGSGERMLEQQTTRMHAQQQQHTAHVCRVPGSGSVGGHVLVVCIAGNGRGRREGEGEGEAGVGKQQARSVMGKSRRQVLAAGRR
jgi:hypothetical protein